MAESVPVRRAESPMTAADRPRRRRFRYRPCVINCPHDSRAAAANRGADGDLPRPANAAREDEIRDVGRGQQQHESHDASHHERRGPQLVADDGRVERFDIDVNAAIRVGRLARDTVGDRAQVRSRLVNGNAQAGVVL